MVNSKSRKLSHLQIKRKSIYSLQSKFYCYDNAIIFPITGRRGMQQNPHEQQQRLAADQQQGNAETDLVTANALAHRAVAVDQDPKA